MLNRIVRDQHVVMLQGKITNPSVILFERSCDRGSRGKSMWTTNGLISRNIYNVPNITTACKQDFVSSL